MKRPTIQLKAVLCTIFVLLKLNAEAQLLQYVKYYQQGINYAGIASPSNLTTDLFGKNVYITSLTQNTLAVYSRNNTTGDLSYLQMFQDNINGVDGLRGARAAVISPNRKNVYVAGTTDAAIAVFSRNLTLGDLTFLEIKKDGVGDVLDLGLPTDIKISSDNKHLYASGTSGLIAFNIDATTGSLSYINTYYNRGTITDEFYPTSLTISPDDQYIYSSSSADSSISVFSRDATTGELTFYIRYKNGTAGISNMSVPSNITILPPDGKFIYLSCSRDSSILAFSRDENTGLLSFLNFYKQGTNGIDGLITINSVSYDNDGNNLYITSIKDSSITTFSRNNTDGSLSYVNTIKNGQNGATGIKGCRYALVSNNGKQVYTAGYYNNAITTFNRDLSTGSLVYNKSIANGVLGNDGLIAPTYLATDPGSSKNIYVGSSTQNTISSYSRDNITGEISFQQTLLNNTNGVSGLKGLRAIVVSPNKKNVYAASVSDLSIAVFSRNISNGLLTFLEVKKDGVGDVLDLGSPIDIKITSDNKYLYAGSFSGLVVFSINQTNGSLSYVGTYYDRGTNTDEFYPSNIILSLDNKYIYAASSTDSSISIFKRNAVTGIPTFITSYKNNTSGISNMTQPSNLNISPLDGKYLYATSSRDSLLISFQINPTTGLLTFHHIYKNGTNGISGLTFISASTIDSYGKNMYISNIKDSSVLVFQRNSNTGILTFSEKYKQSENGIGGIKGARYTTISADGNFLYTVGNVSNSIALFKIINAPIEPQNIKTKVVDGNIKITWDPNPELNITSYEIFRNTANDSSGATVLTSITGTTSYTDNTANKDVYYYYWIKAVNSNGHKSAYSEVDSAKIITVVISGINHESTEIMLNIYPNPSSGIFNINLSDRNDISEIEIINTYGMPLSIPDLQNKKSVMVDLSSYPEGVYFLKLRGEKINKTVKLIKK